MGVAGMFRDAIQGNHGHIVGDSLKRLRNRFVTDENTEGYVKDGSVAVARFELGDNPDVREERIMREPRKSGEGRMIRQRRETFSHSHRVRFCSRQNWRSSVSSGLPRVV